MPQRRIGAFEVSAVGLGCMNLSHAYGSPPSDADAEALLLGALEQGVTLFDTAALYGFGSNERLLGRVLKPHRGHIVLASKGGMTGIDGRRVIDSRPTSLQRNCEASLQRLQADVIDLYYLHRWDKQVPVEDSVGAMSRLVEQGKVRAIGLSEVSAGTLRKAHAVHPVSAVQTEYSLWTRNPEIALLQACRELGAALVAFSPLGRGMLTGRLRNAGAFPPTDIRRGMPRFQPDHFSHNLALVDRLAVLAARAGCTAGQLALAWLLAQGEDIVPIPGTTQAAHLLQNIEATVLRLDGELLAEAGRLIGEESVSGVRYPAAAQTEIDTECFLPDG